MRSSVPAVELSVEMERVGGRGPLKPADAPVRTNLDIRGSEWGVLEAGNNSSQLTLLSGPNLHISIKTNYLRLENKNKTKLQTSKKTTKIESSMNASNNYYLCSMFTLKNNTMHTYYHTYMLKYSLPVPQTVCRPVRTYQALPPLDPFDAGSLRSFHT